MVENLTDKVREFLLPIQGTEVSLDYLRRELKIDPNSPAWDGIRVLMFRLTEEKVVKPTGKRTGIYRVIKQVKPVKIFSVKRERKPPFELRFPRDFDTGVEMEIANHVVIRNGDCILLSGQSNWGKTTLVMQFLAENIDYNPILLGNEFSKDDEPTPRFLNRLDAMDWVDWTNGDGEDKFTLLPVYGDFAEHVVKDRINFIDWINLPGEYYMISPLMESLKHAVGGGIIVPVLQKNEGTDYGRGGYPTKDFADLELLIDRHSSNESRLTVGKVKESKGLITGRSWVYEIDQGVKLRNVREVVKCFNCYGKGWKKSGQTSVPCDTCNKTGYVDK